MEDKKTLGVIFLADYEDVADMLERENFDIVMIGHGEGDDKNAYYVLFICRDQQTLNYLWRLLNRQELKNKKQWPNARPAEDHLNHLTLSLTQPLSVVMQRLKTIAEIDLHVFIEPDAEHGKTWDDFTADNFHHATSSYLDDE